MNQLKSTWLVTFVVAFIVSIVLLYLVEADKLKGFEGTLVAVNVGVAIFAINFSFIRPHSENALWRLWISVRESDKGGAFAKKIQDLLARYVITKADNSKECSDEAFFALGLMGSIATHALEGGNRNSSPNFFAIFIPRGIVFADGHHCATLGWK